MINNLLKVYHISLICSALHLITKFGLVSYYFEFVPYAQKSFWMRVREGVTYRVERN